jgi:hypothetical protein
MPQLDFVMKQLNSVHILPVSCIFTAIFAALLCQGLTGFLLDIFRRISGSNSCHENVKRNFQLHLHVAFHIHTIIYKKIVLLLLSSENLTSFRKLIDTYLW